MKTGALVLGIIGGLVALFLGMVGYGISGLADVTDGTGGIFRFWRIVLQVTALIGGGILKAKPIIGSALMAVAAVGIVLVLGFHFFSLVPVVLLLVVTIPSIPSTTPTLLKTEFQKIRILTMLILSVR